MGAGGVEILDGERELGEPAVAVRILPVLLDEAQILRHRLAELAALDEEPGIFLARLQMLAVEPEDVAELDHRPVGVALGEQRHAALVMLLGALLGGVAGGERHGAGEEQGGEAEATGKSGKLSIGSGLSASATRASGRLELGRHRCGPNGGGGGWQGGGGMVKAQGCTPSRRQRAASAAGSAPRPSRSICRAR